MELTLEQTPRVQGTIFSYDHSSGYVLAMVGGDDYDRSEFNRVSQACRQPGSVYKPMYYSLALDRGYGFASLLNDVPRAEVDPVTGEVWTPTNLNNTVDYQVTLEYALIWSKNVPSVQLFKLMGGKDVEAWARRLGITTPIIPDQALALGASCTRIDELTRAFSAFAKQGAVIDPVYIRRIRNRIGAVIEDHTSIGDPFGTPSERLDPSGGAGRRRAAEAGHPAPHRLAHLDAAPPRRHPRPRAGDPHGRSAGGRQDGHLQRHHGHLVHRLHLALDDSTWIGDDLRERPLGQKDAAFMLTVPMFARYMTEVTARQPLVDVPWERPPGVKSDDTGGKLRTTMEEVMADGQTDAATAAHKPKQVTPRAPTPAAPAHVRRGCRRPARRPASASALRTPKRLYRESRSPGRRWSPARRRHHHQVAIAPSPLRPAAAPRRRVKRSSRSRTRACSWASARGRGSRA